LDNKIIYWAWQFYEYIEWFIAQQGFRYVSKSTIACEHAHGYLQLGSSSFATSWRLNMRPPRCLWKLGTSHPVTLLQISQKCETLNTELVCFVLECFTALRYGRSSAHRNVRATNVWSNPLYL
jgi:hypothetical protein